MYQQMSVATLPNEIFIQIVKSLSLQDQKTCMLTCHSWNERFISIVLKNLVITTRAQFKSLLSKLEKSFHTQKLPLGLIIRRLTLGSHVGITNTEFHLLPIYCPFLEYFDFNPVLWKYFSYTNNMKKWIYITRFPCMQRAKLTIPILRDSGMNMTQLELNSMIIDELRDIKYTVLTLLSYTPNLIHLKLSNGIKNTKNLTITDFESMHRLCPALEKLELDSFNVLLIDLIDIETIPIANKLKELRLKNISLHNENILKYWGHKYSTIETLYLELKLLEAEQYHEQAGPENSIMKEYFTMMASKFTKLFNLEGKFDEKYFPCDIFLRGINHHEMKNISIEFLNFDYVIRTARNFKILLNRSMETLKSLHINNWNRSWDYEQDILIPMGKCTYLNSLSLSPQPGNLTEFDIDIILDYSTSLKSLELKNIYNLFIRSDLNKTRIHGLKSFSLKHTMINNQLFDYLAVRCPDLTKLDISYVTKPYDNDIQVTINMPKHSFDYIHINGLKLGLRIEDSGFQCNCSSVICSLEETKRVLTKRGDQERWYHLYQPKKKHACNPLKPRLQRLKPDQVRKLKEIKITPHIWEQISFAGVRLLFESKKNWEFDIPYGYTSIKCYSVNEFIFEGVSLY